MANAIQKTANKGAGVKPVKPALARPKPIAASKLMTAKPKPVVAAKPKPVVAAKPKPVTTGPKPMIASKPLSTAVPASGKKSKWWIWAIIIVIIIGIAIGLYLGFNS